MIDLVAGYGHIAPKTNLGKVVTMFYAIIGIPLTLLTITNLGGFMATAFRFIYRNICCGLCCLCCSPSKPSSSYTVADTSRRTRRGNRRPVANRYGGGGGSTTDNGTQSRGRKNGPPSAGVVVPPPTLRERLRRILDTDDIKSVTVPIYVSLLLITGYIAVGALMFMLWEHDWSYLVGCYFCFITLSTIGFGDYVPGTSIDASASQEKLVICALYLVFGLALLAMCFDLMQEQARSHFRTIGRKLGLLDDKS